MESKYWNLEVKTVPLSDGDETFLVTVNLLGHMAEILDTITWSKYFNREHPAFHPNVLDMWEDQAVIELAPQVNEHEEKMQMQAGKLFVSGNKSLDSSPFIPEVWSDELKRQYELQLDAAKLQMERDIEMEKVKMQAKAMGTSPLSGLGSFLGFKK